MSDSENTQGSDTQGMTVETAVAAQVHPNVQRVFDLLRLAVAQVPVGKAMKMPELDKLRIEQAIAEASSVAPTKAAKAPATHEPGCHSLPANQPRDELGNVIPEQVYVDTKLGEVPEALRSMPGVAEAVEKAARGLYVCDCALAKRRTSSGNRAMPQHSGPVGITVHRIENGAVVESYAAPNMSQAAAKLASWYPDAKQCHKYVADIAAGQSANARKYIESDLKGNRLPEGAVVWTVETPAAEPQTETTPSA